MGYENETRNAYRNTPKAEAYHNYLAKDFSWAHFMMWREKQCVLRGLLKCNLSKSDIILDLPCGTGIFADVVVPLNSKSLSSDISIEMMEIARKAYKGEQFLGFTQSDITQIPIRDLSVSCTVVIGFMHRVSPKIRMKVMDELSRVSKKYIIVSYSIDSLFQTLKKKVIYRIFKNIKAAPSPSKFEDIRLSFATTDFKIKKVYKPFPFLSSDIIFLLERRV